MAKIVIKNLHVSVKDKEILKGLNFVFDEHESVALLGPNGNGKSTLIQTIMGNPNYQITEGSIYLDDKDITTLEADERSKLGIFLGMQYPSEVPGVNNADFLKAAINAHQEKPVSLFKFYQMLDQAYKRTSIPFEMSTRNLNEGFSGGEKKKNEILQMKMLEPSFIMLDEIDSGVDVDALKIVGDNINAYKKEKPLSSYLIITHYTHLLKYVKPDFVHVVKEGKIVKTGDYMLAKTIENNGFNFEKIVSKAFDGSEVSE